MTTAGVVARALKNSQSVPLIRNTETSSKILVRYTNSPFLLGVACICLFAAPILFASQNLDVRLLIDVSGSMQANDPENLRVPAVRLVAEVMPRGATSGMWTFNERVEPLVPTAIVDDEWKKSVFQTPGLVLIWVNIRKFRGDRCAYSCDPPK